MANVELYEAQIDAIRKAHNGCIICGGTGSGKSRTGLAYYYLKVCNGKLKINGKGDWGAPKTPRDLYIITPPVKRDKHEWEHELLPFLISTENKDNPGGIKVKVDSWNNLHKYTKVYGAFFLFDEQRVKGKGPWVKRFLNIARKNQFILLSATPGDKWEDYVPMFIANGFFKNRSEFNARHVIFSPYSKFPQVLDYRHEGILNKYRRDLLINIDLLRNTEQHHEDVMVSYNKVLYKKVWKDRWDPYDNCPIEETGKLFYLLRKVVNDSTERIDKTLAIMKDHPRVIIFYNYDYELNALKYACKSYGFEDRVVKEWNGHLHEPVPTSEKWVYLCQYSSACEGWNCITTNTIIFFSQSYSYSQTVQAAGRIDRSNTPFIDLYYYHLRSNAPIDVAIKRALSQKKNFNEQAFLGKKK